MEIFYKNYMIATICVLFADNWRLYGSNIFMLVVLFYTTTFLNLSFFCFLPLYFSSTFADHMCTSYDVFYFN